MKYFKIFILLLIALLLGLSIYFFKKPETPKVSVIGVGFPKCGTTSLFSTLEKNPSLHFMKRPYDLNGLVTANEINFFGNLSKKSYVRLGLYGKEKKKIFRPPLKFYKSLLFKDKVNIEKSPQYIWKKEALKEIYRYNPNAKILVQIREPINWLYSYYKHAKKHYDEPDLTDDITFEEFLNIPCPNDKSVTVKEAARFALYLKDVLEIFPKENVIVLAHENLNQFKSMQELSSFLSLPCPKEAQNISLTFKKPPDYKDKISKELYTSLKEYYNPYNQELYKICENSFWDYE